MIQTRIFLDANVLFSAAYRPASRIARLWRLRNVELVTSLYAAEEARVNLSEHSQLQRLEKLLGRMRIVSGLAPFPHSVLLPEKDRPILQAAIHCKATHLLTGDKLHFGRYFGTKIMGVLILLPSQYFRIYLKDS